MTQTVASLLQEVNLSHQIPETDPVLAIPLERFKEFEYSTIVTLLELYDKKLITTLDNKTARAELGELSEQEAEDFFSAIKEQVTTRLQDLKKSTQNLEPLQIPPNSKITRASLTRYLIENDVYQNLFNSKAFIEKTSHNQNSLVNKSPLLAKSLLSPVKYRKKPPSSLTQIVKIPISITVGDLLEEINLPHQIPENDPILAIYLEQFSESEYPTLIALVGLYDKKLITTDSKTPSMPLGELSAKQAAEFFYGVKKQIKSRLEALQTEKQHLEPLNFDTKITPASLTHYLVTNKIYQILFNPTSAIKQENHQPSSLSLIDKYPTLEKLLQSFPIRQRKNLPPALAEIAQMPIAEIEKFHDELLDDMEIIKLACYLVLFISEKATLEKNLLDFTYTNDAEKEKLENIILLRSASLLISLGNKKNIPISSVDVTFSSELSKKNIFYKPAVLGLLCLDCSPLLRKLLQRNISSTTTLSNPLIALIPSENPFFLGINLCEKATNIPLKASNHDLGVIASLIQIVNQAKAQGSLFFTEKETKTNNLQMQFTKNKNKIKDPDLSSIITVESLESYVLKPIVNSHALIQFIMNHTPKIDTINEKTKKIEEQKEITTKENTLSTEVFSEEIPATAFLRTPRPRIPPKQPVKIPSDSDIGFFLEAYNLMDEPYLFEQLAKKRHALRAENILFNQENIKELALLFKRTLMCPPFELTITQKKWLKIQLHIFSGLNNLLEAKKQQIQVEQMHRLPADDNNSPSSSYRLY